jgi:hypothetical protein
MKQRACLPGSRVFSNKSILSLGRERSIANRRTRTSHLMRLRMTVFVFMDENPGIAGKWLPTQTG